MAHIKSLIVDEQHGFMVGRSCSSQLISVLDVWTQILDKRESLDAVYLDFQKAFDMYVTKDCLRNSKLTVYMDPSMNG